MDSQSPQPAISFSAVPASSSPKIIIVEDNQALAEIYKTRLELLGYICFVAYNGITGLYFIQKEIPDLVLLDLMIPDIAGEQVLATLRASDWGRDIPVYILSNLNESEAPGSLRRLGIAGYSVKSTMSDDTVDRIVNSILRPGVNAAPAASGLPPSVTPLQAQAASMPLREPPGV